MENHHFQNGQPTSYVSYGWVSKCEFSALMRGKICPEMAGFFFSATEWTETQAAVSPISPSVQSMPPVTLPSAPGRISLKDSFLFFQYSIAKLCIKKSAKWQRVLKPVSFGPRQSKENIANRINRTSKQFDCQDIRNLAWWQPTFDKKRERVTMEFCALIALDTLDFFGARRNFTTMAQREQPKAQAKPAP